MTALTRAALLATVASAAGCDIGTPPNLTSPDIDDVFATPAAIEQTILSGYLSCRNTVEAGEMLQQLAVMSLEASGASSSGFILRVSIPREVVANAAGATSIYDDFRSLALGGRLAANAVYALERLLRQNGSLSSDREANMRARAFGYFAIGCHQGWLAMMYDSAGVATPFLPKDTVPALSASAVVMQSAISMLDSAIAIALRADTTKPGGFPLPTTWINTSVAMSRYDFVRVARSYRARFRAGVARTPAQRALVNWADVTADADSGITSDFLVNVSNAGTPRWSPGANVSSGNAALAPAYYGMADVSGRYDAWLALPLTQRDTFLIQTPDLRWPQGATTAAQQTASVAPTSLASRPYFRNRPLTGAGGPTPYLRTQYDVQRLEFIRTAVSLAGGYPEITKAEMNLLAAEGYLNAGNVAAAAARIDITRVGRGGLPALSGVVTTATQPVPGGASCVPRVPQGPAFTSTACGTILEALKWEKRMETGRTGFGQWYFDGRGWGDLVQGTAYEFPVPYQELLARNRPLYSLGGGLGSSAVKGTYGF